MKEMNPEERLKVARQIFNEVIPMHKFLGLELLEVREGYALVRVPFREEFVGDPRSRRLHGGLMSATMDGAAGMAGMTTLQDAVNDLMTTIDLRIDYMHGMNPEPFLVEAEVARKGKRVVTTRMRAWHENEPEAERKVLAEGRAVFHVSLGADRATAKAEKEKEA